MPYFASDVFPVVVGSLFLFGGLAYAFVLFVPSIGRRVYGKFWPADFTSMPQRRAAYVRAVAYAGWLIGIGGNFLLRQPISSVCGIQDTLQRLSLGSLLLGFSCLVVALLAQRRGNLVPQSNPPNPKITRIAGIIGVLLLIGICGFLYYSFRRISSGFETLNSIVMTSPTQGWAVGSTANFGGMIYQFHDGGWTKEVDNLPSMVMDLDMISASEGWAVSNGDFLLHFHDGVWTQVPSPAHELKSIDMVASDEGWAVGNFGAIVHYQNGRWTQTVSPTDQALEGISMLSGEEGWAVGGGDYYQRKPSIILHYRDGHWTKIDNPVTAPLTSIDMVSATEGWIVGGTRFTPITSTLLHYQNGTWTQVASPVTIPLTDIQMISAGEGWAVGGDFFDVPSQCPESTRSVRLNAIAHYQNGTWTVVTSPNDELLKAIAMVSPSDGWIVGWDTILRYTKDGWQEVKRLK